MSTVLRCLLLVKSILWFAETASIGLIPLKFDNLGTDLKDLKYAVEEEDLDDYFRLFDESDSTENKGITSGKTTGFQKKNASSKGSNANHDIEDLKKFFKAVGAHDQGSFDDDKSYSTAQAYGGNAVRIQGKEDRKYKKGSKIRGFHRVHHKDEYKKDKLLYEDDETSGAINKVGAKALAAKVGAGTKFDKGHFHHNRQKGVYGKRRYSDKGFADKMFDDFSDSQGFDDSFSKER